MVHESTGSKELGRAIMKYRKRIGYSREDLASEFDFTKSLIDKWEIGDRMPTLENLLVMAYIFEVNPLELLILTLPSDEESDIEKGRLQKSIANIKEKLIEVDDLKIARRYQEAIFQLSRLKRLEEIKNAFRHLIDLG